MRGFQNLTGGAGSCRVASGDFVKSHGSGRVNSFSDLAGRIGSGQVERLSIFRGSSRVESTRVRLFASRVGLVDPYLTRPVRFEVTSEKP